VHASASVVLYLGISLKRSTFVSSGRYIKPELSPLLWGLRPLIRHKQSCLCIPLGLSSRSSRPHVSKYWMRHCPSPNDPWATKQPTLSDFEWLSFRSCIDNKEWHFCVHKVYYRPLQWCRSSNRSGVCVRTITFEWGGLWPGHLARWFNLTLSRSNFKVIRSKFMVTWGNSAKVVGVTSSEGCLVLCKIKCLLGGDLA